MGTSLSQSRTHTSHLVLNPPSLLQELWSDLFVVKGVDLGKEQLGVHLDKPCYL